MSARSLLVCWLCAAASLALCSCSTPRSATPTPTSTPSPAPSQSPTPPTAETAKDIQGTIARVERHDPQSPALLNAQLSYAESLLTGSAETCADRLERAQEQLGSIDANPEVRVMFPDGWASVADLDYRMHLARADCKTADRHYELSAALVAARRAVDLYRKVFDYRSMVVMQFDAGTALRELGDDTAAMDALKSAVSMDREYGFADDAAENYKLLLSWQGKPAGDDQVAQLMRDFPKRQAVLRFGWRAGDSQVTIESRRRCLDEGQIFSSRAAAMFERHISRRNEGNGWNVAYSNRLNEYEPGVWPTLSGSGPPSMMFPPALLPSAGFRVTATGDFDGATDSAAFAPQLTAKADELIRAAAPSDARAHNLLDEALEISKSNLAPGMLEASAAENYQLETAMWIGAKLDQGVWYEIDAPLPLPGMPRIVVKNHIEFAYTRSVPCTPGAPEPTCVEIVIRATPDKDAVDRVTADFGPMMPHGRFEAYIASTQARIVTDPQTLLAFAREQQVYWYASLGKGKGDTVLQSEHLVAATRYTGLQ